MIPVTLNFQCQTNSDYVEEFTVKNGVELVDLTGLIVEQVFKTHAAGEEVFTLSTVETDIEGWQVLDGGVLVVRFDRETLSNAFDNIVENVQVGVTIHFVHDIKVIHSDGFVEVWAVGTLSVMKGIS